jgi:hypothetical protein
VFSNRFFSSLLFIILFCSFIYSLTNSNGEEFLLKDLLTSKYNIIISINEDNILENISNLKELSKWSGGSINFILNIPDTNPETIKKLEDVLPSIISPYSGIIDDDISINFNTNAIYIIDETGALLYSEIDREIPGTIEEIFVNAGLPMPQIPELSQGRLLPIFTISGVSGLINTGDLLKTGPLVIFITDINNDRLLDDLQRMQFLSDDLSGKYRTLCLVKTEDLKYLLKLKERLNLSINIAVLSKIVEESYVGTDELPVLIITNEGGIVIHYRTGAFPPEKSEIEKLVKAEQEIYDKIELEILKDEVILKNLTSSWIPGACFLDEERIVYSAISQKTKTDNLFIYYLDKNKTEELTFSKFQDLYPTAIGNTVLFYSLRSENEDLWIFNIDTREFIQITDNISYDEYADISPNGDEIVFQSNRDDNFNIWICGPLGRNQTRITVHKGMDVHPSYCPDGSGRIAFVSNRSGNPDIFIIRRDRKGLSQITYNKADDLFPKWTPDGTRIAFASNREGNYDIFLISDDSSQIAQITSNKANEFPLCWNDKGDILLYLEEVNNKFNVHILELREKIEKENEIETDESIE